MSRGCVFYYFDIEISKLPYFKLKSVPYCFSRGVNIGVEVYYQSPQTPTLFKTENVYFATLSKTGDLISRPWFISVRIQN